MLAYAGTAVTLSPVTIALIVIAFVAFAVCGTFVYACSQS